MATAGVEQNKPTLTPGVANVDFSVARTMSQLATSWQPAAVATPFTMATTGTGMSWISVMTWETRVTDKFSRSTGHKNKIRQKTVGLYLSTGLEHLCVIFSSLSWGQLLQVMSRRKNWTFGWKTTQTLVNIETYTVHTHVYVQYNHRFANHQPEMMITLRSSLCMSVRMFSLRDSSIDRDRAFLFLGLFRIILLEKTNKIWGKKLWNYLSTYCISKNVYLYVCKDTTIIDLKHIKINKGLNLIKKTYCKNDRRLMKNNLNIE